MPYRDCQWIVRDPDLLGRTRLSVSFVLACLAEGMSAKEIAQTYGPFPQEAIIAQIYEASSGSVL